MGRPMAGHLVEAGHELFVRTRRAPPKELIDKGAVACANGKEVGEKAEVIIIMVPDTPDVETVLFGAEGVAEGLSKGVNLTDSVGFQVSGDGLIGDIVPDSPASKAGLAPGMKLLAVNGRRFTPDGLKGAVAATNTGGKLELLAESGDFFKTHALDYKGGARYPRLVKTDGKDDLLTEIVKPKTK